LRLEQVGPALRHRQAAQCIDVDHDAQGAGVDRKPLAGGVFQPGGDLFPALGLVTLDHAGLLRLQAEGHAVVDHVGDGRGLFGHQLRQGLAGVLVVQRHLHPRVGSDGLELGAPVGPVRRAVVANSRFGGLGQAGHAAEQHGG